MTCSTLRMAIWASTVGGEPCVRLLPLRSYMDGPLDAFTSTSLSSLQYLDLKRNSFQVSLLLWPACHVEFNRPPRHAL
jgi:hypothetical protein